MTPVPCLTPGIYEGVPAEEYHAWDAASNSRLSILAERSPAHLRHAIDFPAEPTDSQVLGTATHVAILEPRTFHLLYTPAEQCEALTRDGKGPRCSKRGVTLYAPDRFRCASHPLAGVAPGRRTVFSEAEFERCLAMRDAVHLHPAARALLAEAAGRELSIVWVDPQTGVTCKARLDGLAGSVGAVLDLKTTEDASPAGWPRSVYRWGYHRQGAFYLDGAAAVGIDCTDFAQIAVEKPEPHAVGVYRVDDAALEAGRRQLQRLLGIYAECQRSGVWPAYSERIEPITLPAYAWGQIETEMT